MADSKIKVLIVEDEGVIALDMKMTLTGTGYQVTGIVDNYDDLITQIKKLKPDILLMDINIKGPVDGIESAQRVYSLYHIPSLFLTADEDSKTMEKVSHVHSLGLMTKPFNDSKFIELMRSFISNNDN